jgi:uncharacterized protein (TIGR00288 family)
MQIDKVMLLIDADNVSIDVMEQAVRLLLNQHGGLHVRRAYCTAESAVANQAVFKRLGIKPMVNLAAGKNSTDIALAVDAVDLVLAERPGVVVIASSDSDFAPLVQRLREKGCVVRGIGQMGKVADETQGVYDDYTVLEHHKTASPAAAKKTARKPAAKKVAVAVQAQTSSPSSSPSPSPAPPPVRKATPKPAAKVKPAPASQRASRPASQPASQPAKQPAATRSASERAEPILACLPELQSGATLELRGVSVRLREAGLLSRSSSSVKLLSPLADVFELLPPNQPNRVRLRQ